MPTYQVCAMHRLICEKLEAVERGDCKRLMIFTPPRHGKSELVSKRFPAYALGRKPRRQVISASYGADLADGFGRDVRNIVASNEYARLFPDTRLSPDSQARNRWHTTDGGSYVSAGVGGAITGRGADILNIDDPVKDRADAESEKIRDTAWDWYTSTAYTRLMPDGAVIVTMTRWHEDDLAGRLLAEAKSGGDQWDILCLQGLSAAKDDPLNRAPGEALWPDRYDVPALEKIRSVIGERDFGALYQQDPRPSGTSFFSEDHVLVNGAGVTPPVKCHCVFAVMDTAVKTGTKNDGTGVTYFALSKHGDSPLIVLDWDIVQIEGSLLEAWLPSVYENLERLAVASGARMGSLGVFVEDKASGTILLQQARRRRDAAGRPWQAREIDSKLTAMGKDERAISVSGYVHRGMIKMSKHAYDKMTAYKGRNANHFLAQVFRFQIGVKDQADDLLDTFCYGIALALGNKQGF